MTYVDDCAVAVDLRVLNRDRHLRNQLSKGASLTVQIGAASFTLPLLRWSWAFGGTRLFVEAPCCGSAVGVLREAPDGATRLICKACLWALGARYRSQFGKGAEP